MSLPLNTTIDGDNVTTTVAPDPHGHDLQNEIEYLVVPLIVVILIMLCSALVRFCFTNYHINICFCVLCRCI